MAEPAALPSRGRSALLSAVSKLTLVHALTKSSMLTPGAPVFVKVTSNGEVSASGAWRVGTAKTVADATADPAQDNQHSESAVEPRRRVAVELSDGAVVDVIDSTDTTVFHANRTRGWDPTCDVADLCAVPDNHQATVDVSFDNFIKRQDARCVHVGGNEMCLLKDNGGQTTAVALERASAVVLGADLSDEAPTIRALVRSKFGDERVRAMTSLRSVLAVLNYVYVADSFGLQLVFPSNSDALLLRPYFGHIDVKASSFLATPNSAGRTLESLLNAFAAACSAPAATVDTSLKLLRAASALLHLPISATGLKPPQEETLEDIATLSGASSKAMKALLFPPRGQVTTTSIDDCKAQYVHAFTTKAMHGLFRPLAPTPADIASSFRIIAIPPISSDAADGDSPANLALEVMFNTAIAARLDSLGVKESASGCEAAGRLEGLLLCIENNSTATSETLASRLVDVGKGVTSQASATTVAPLEVSLRHVARSAVHQLRLGQPSKPKQNQAHHRGAHLLLHLLQPRALLGPQARLL
jgi:hypothetical protein